MDSKIGLVIQFTGIFLITVLSLFLRRSLRSSVSAYWLAAWSSLSFALFSLSLAFSYPHLSRHLFWFYFFGEYVFGLMLIAGCRKLSGDSVSRRKYSLIFVTFAVVALALALAAGDFNLVFNLHALSTLR